MLWHILHSSWHQDQHLPLLLMMENTLDGDVQWLTLNGWKYGFDWPLFCGKWMTLKWVGGNWLLAVLIMASGLTFATTAHHGKHIWWWHPVACFNWTKVWMWLALVLWKMDDIKMSWRQLIIGHAHHGIRINICHYCSWKTHWMVISSCLLELDESMDAIGLLFCEKWMTLKWFGGKWLFAVLNVCHYSSQKTHWMVIIFSCFALHILYGQGLLCFFSTKIPCKHDH